MNEMGGLGQIAPNLSIFFALAILASIGLPGFANFWGNSLYLPLLLSLYPHDGHYLAALGIIILAVYGLRAVGNIVFGVAKENVNDSNFSAQVGDMNGIYRNSQPPYCWLVYCLWAFTLKYSVIFQMKHFKIYIRIIRFP